MKNELITHSNPKSVISEAIKTIRTNLLFSSLDEKIKTILITSSIPGEGKSFLTSNLAIAFSQNDLNVLIIDCDLRKGRLHHIFDLENKHGLSNLLLEEKINKKDYVQKTKIKNVSLISTGILPPNPSEILATEKFNLVLESLKKDFDIIILDSPPVSIVSDALVLTKKVDQTVIVAANRKVQLKEVENTKKQILNVGGKIAGVILNKKKVEKKEYYNKYYN